MPMYDDAQASLDRMRQELLEEEDDPAESRWEEEEDVDSEAADSWEESDGGLPERDDRGRRILVFLLALAALAWAACRFLV